ncbi:hypothetical protein JHK82_013536 [Glycine max]|nr:hypothetical protein JHK86_013551 [Glycine max]KAG5155567.1 hypothetical protein JHK82_013536 [Glycine max]
MDVFIPEEYAIKAWKSSKSHLHRNNNATESTHNKVSLSTTHPPKASYISNGFGLVADNVVFTCLSA